MLSGQKSFIVPLLIEHDSFQVHIVLVFVHFTDHNQFDESNVVSSYIYSFIYIYIYIYELLLVNFVTKFSLHFSMNLEQI